MQFTLALLFGASNKRNHIGWKPTSQLMVDDLLIYQDSSARRFCKFGSRARTVTDWKSIWCLSTHTCSATADSSVFACFTADLCSWILAPRRRPVLTCKHVHAYSHILDHMYMYASIPDLIWWLKQKVFVHHLYTAPTIVDTCPTTAKQHKGTKSDKASSTCTCTCTRMHK